MLRAALRHDRALVLAAVSSAILLAWVWLWLGAGLGMERMDMGGGQIMLMAPAWSPGYAVAVFLMWAVMMAAMMLPSAAPAILLVDTLARQRVGWAGAALRFALGYLIVWTAFSLLATGLQFGLDRAGLLRVDMASASPAFAGALLIAAGLYQWSPSKGACLAHCRAPFEFLTRHWPRGPLRAGLYHGAYCVGCCWVLMALLFVGGLMNLIWIAALATLVLLEKTLPVAGWPSRAVGALLTLWGALILAFGADVWLP